MKTLQKKTIILCLIMLPCITYSKQSNKIENNEKSELEIFEEWRLRKEKENIKIYTRWVDTGEEERKAREMKAVFTLSVNIKDVVKVIRGDGYTPQWLDRVQNSFNFKEEEELVWHSYTEFNIPWPFENQSIVTRNQIFYDSTGRISHIEFQSADILLQDKEGVKRIEGFKSSWVFKPRPSGEMNVTYTVYSEMKPIMPRWFTDPIVENGIWKSMDNFRNVVINQESEDNYAENIADSKE